MTHPLLTGNAMERLNRPEVTELVVTDSVPLQMAEVPDKVTVLTVAPLLGEAIRRIHHSESVSALFDPSRPQGPNGVGY